MRIFDHFFDTPEENLAADDALLEAAEAGEVGEILRFWESPKYFVALGYTNKISTETDADACRALGIPILRRASGGGTVLQGPLCWNYALILSIESRPEIATITGSNTWVMQQQATAISQVLGARVEVAGHTDLTVDGRKFSGNAQKRKRRFTLIHGTILLQGFDVELIARTLKMPERRPDYRASRGHLDFVRTLDVSRDDLRGSMASTWGAREPLSDEEFPHELMRRLISERYGRAEWNEKF